MYVPTLPAGTLQPRCSFRLSSTVALVCVTLTGDTRHPLLHQESGRNRGQGDRGKDSWGDSLKEQGCVRGAGGRESPGAAGRQAGFSTRGSCAAGMGGGGQGRSMGCRLQGGSHWLFVPPAGRAPGSLQKDSPGHPARAFQPAPSRWGSSDTEDTRHTPGHVAATLWTHRPVPLPTGQVANPIPVRGEPGPRASVLSQLLSVACVCVHMCVLLCVCCVRALMDSGGGARPGEGKGWQMGDWGPGPNIQLDPESTRCRHRRHHQAMDGDRAEG